MCIVSVFFNQRLSLLGVVFERWRIKSPMLQDKGKALQ